MAHLACSLILSLSWSECDNNTVRLFVCLFIFIESIARQGKTAWEISGVRVHTGLTWKLYLLITSINTGIKPIEFTQDVQIEYWVNGILLFSDRLFIITYPYIQRLHVQWERVHEIDRLAPADGFRSRNIDCTICGTIRCGRFAHILFKWDSTSLDNRNTRLSIEHCAKLVLILLKWQLLLFFNSSSTINI